MWIDGRMTVGVVAPGVLPHGPLAGRKWLETSFHEREDEPLTGKAPPAPCRAIASNTNFIFDLNFFSALNGGALPPGVPDIEPLIFVTTDG